MTHIELYAEYSATREANQTFEQWLICVIDAQNEQLAELVVANQTITRHAGNMALAAQMSHEQVCRLYGDLDERDQEIISLQGQLKAIRLWAINGHLAKIVESLSQRPKSIS